MMNLHKYYTKAVICITSIVMAINLLGCSPAAGSNNTTEPISTEQNYSDTLLQAFDNFTDELFRKEVSDNTITLHSFVKNPQQYGINDYKATLGDYEFDSLGDTTEIMDSMNRLSTFKYEELSKEQQITYSVLKDTLTTALEYSDLYLYNSELTPYSGTPVQLPIILSMYSFNSRRDIDDYIALLNDTVRYYSQIIEYETLRADKGIFMCDSVADEMIEQCMTFINENSSDSSFMITTFDKRIDAFNGLTEDERNAYKAANRKAVSDSVLPAYRILADGVTRLKGSGKYEGGLASYPDGKKYYESLLKSDFGWSKSVEELDKLVDRYISTVYIAMNATVASEPSILQNQKLTDFSFTQTEPAPILTDLRKKLTKDFPDAPDASYNIEYIDKSLEDKANPAMYIMPPIDDFTNNNILINQKACEPSDLYPTLAHEGYPGHMYQTTYFYSKKPSPIRILLQYGGYAEGWASYCEIYAYNLDDKASDNKMYNLMANNQLLTLGLYAKMDIGVNYYGWSAADLNAYLRQWGISDTDDTEFIFNYLIAEPCSYPRYSIGCYAFLDWRNQASAELGDKFDLKEFHKFILELGYVPFDVIDKRLPVWIEEHK